MKSIISAIILITLSIHIYAQDIKIISSDESSLVVEYTPIFNISSEIIENTGYLNISLSGGEHLYDAEPGMPSIQFKSLKVGVPEEFGNTIQVLEIQTESFEGLLIPLKTIKRDKNGFFINQNTTPTDAYFDASISEDVKFGEYYVLRDLQIQTVNIFPVQFNPVQKKISIIKKIIFKINFSKNQKISNEQIDDFIALSVLNFDVARKWNLKKSGRLKKATEKSVFSEGAWFRFETPEEGIYAITRSMLSSIGIDPSSIDPRTIKIYNNGGKVLPENLNLPRPSGPVENAIMVVGEEDGAFDENDYILFYARGVQFWEYDETSKKITRFKHTYSNANYYWLTFGGGPGKRMTSKESIEGPEDKIQTASEAFAAWEEDLLNRTRSGRIYVGEEFNNRAPDKTFAVYLDGLKQNARITYTVNFLNVSPGMVNIRFYEGSNLLSNSSIGGVGTNPPLHSGVYKIFSMSTFNTPADNRSLFKINFNANTADYGYLDRIEYSYTRELKAENDFMIFFSSDTGKIKYNLSNFTKSSIEIFDITDYSGVKKVNNCFISAGECSFIALESSSKSKYVALTETKYKTPINLISVGNSNLKERIKDVEYIIITHKNFKSEAERLKNFRENGARYKLSGGVVDIDEIFREFSCGMSDPTAVRDFIKYAYDEWEVRPKYVCLFGDGDYDYKNIEGNDKNFILTYQLGYTATDDYFVNMEGDLRPELAVGRLCVQTLDEAKIIVDKIIDYESNRNMSEWQNRIILVADDADADGTREDIMHMGPSENLAINRIPPNFEIQKIYLSLYPIVNTASGKRKPASQEAFIEAINNGASLINYYGHGNPDVLAHERVFDRSTTIPKLFNKDKLPFFSVMACDFGVFDDPYVQSSSELLVNRKEGGCIAVFSASRETYPGPNQSLTEALYSRLLAKNDNGVPVTFGQAIVNAKRDFSSSSDNTLKYVLFGDPALTPSFPYNSAIINTINDEPIQNDYNIKALQQVNIVGKTIDKDSAVINLNGYSVTTFYDVPKLVQMPDLDPKHSFRAIYPGDIIFKGVTELNGGNYSLSFVTPKDISHQYEKGKILIYAYSNSANAAGYTTNIIVGGTDTGAVNDGRGPEIIISYDDQNQSGAYLVNPDFDLVVKLSDETGINSSGGGIGHKLEAILNDKENSPIDLRNSYISDVNSGGKSGVIRHRFSQTPAGNYKIKVKAWDVFNNFSSKESYFTVVDEGVFSIRDLFNYPNPFNSSTAFTFQHNLNEPINVKIKIYSVAGRLLHQIERNYISNKFVKIEWDGRDRDMNYMANGVYLYKIIATTSNGVQRQTALGKLAIIK